MKTAYVLSGGGIRGAFQAGVLHTAENLIQEGKANRPSLVIGISVGSLNGTLMSLHDTNFKELEKFWLKNVKEPNDLFKSKSIPFRIFPGLLRKKFDGMLGVKPLEELIEEIVDISKLQKSSITISVGAVNLSNGKLTFVNQYFGNFKKYLLASSSIPVVMPVVNIGSSIFVDGGLVDVAPITRAIHEGADEIIAVLCQPKETEAKVFDPGNPIELVSRFLDILTDRIVTANVRDVENVNRRIGEFEETVGKHLTKEQKLVALNSVGLQGKRHIKVKILRPPNEFDVSVSSFKEAQIKEMIEIGKYVGREISS